MREPNVRELEIEVEEALDLVNDPLNNILRLLDRSRDGLLHPLEAVLRPVTDRSPGIREE